MKKALKLLPLACLFTSIGTSQEVQQIKHNKVKNVNFTIDEDYNNICATPDHPLLQYIDDETNMLPPDLFENSKGRYILPTSKTFTIKDNATYTLVLYMSNPTELLTSPTSSENKVKITYQPSRNGAPAAIETIEDDVSGSIDVKTLITQGSSTNLSLSQRYDYGMIFISFTIPKCGDRNTVEIKSFDVILDATGKVGTIRNAQLYKGSSEEYRGYNEYAHDPCGLEETEVGPYLDGTKIEVNLPYKRSDQMTADDFKSAVRAFDYGDYKFVDVSIYEDNYTGHFETLDTPLELVIQAEDSSSNISYLTFLITIKDEIPPSINATASKFTFSYKTDVSLEFAKSLFTFSDNYKSGQLDIEFEGIDFDSLVPEVKTYNFTVICTDSSSNSSRYESEITFIDDIPPSIEGPDRIYAEKGQLLDEEEILSHFTAEDEIDGTILDLKITSNTYSSNYDMLGVFPLIVEAADLSNNKMNKTVYVNVDDNEGPVFYVNQTMIEAYEGELISPEQATIALVENGTIPNKKYTKAEYLSGDYLASNGKAGTYQTILVSYAEDGTKQTTKLTIKVHPNKQTNENIFIKFFKDLIAFIKKIFSF